MKLLIVGMTLLTVAPALALVLQCPPKKKGLSLKSLSIYEGHPKGKADLAPDNANSNFPHKWTLKKARPWLVCNYGDKYEKLHNTEIKVQVNTCATIKMEKTSAIYNAIRCQ